MQRLFKGYKFSVMRNFVCSTFVKELVGIPWKFNYFIILYT